MSLFSSSGLPIPLAILPFPDPGNELYPPLPGKHLAQLLVKIVKKS
jgi:hypothetical protein